MRFTSYASEFAYIEPSGKVSINFSRAGSSSCCQYILAGTKDGYTSETDPGGEPTMLLLGASTASTTIIDASPLVAFVRGIRSVAFCLGLAL